MIDLKDFEFVYLFIKDFKWTDIQQSIPTGGHPSPGRVYRAAKNKNDKSYRLVIEKYPFDMVVLETLTSTDGVRGYTSEIIELSAKNVIDVLPTEEDLNLIDKWVNSDNKDVKDAMTRNNEEVELMPVIQSLDRALKQIDESRRIASEAGELLGYLRELNTIQFEVIIGIVEDLIELNESEPDESFTGRLARGNNGSAYNMGRALEAIENYMETEVVVGNNERPENLFQQYLNQGIIALVRESERRELNELN
jgi:hypothetical protein